MATNTSGLNEYQERRLSVTCRHIDKLLSDIEAVLWASASKSPFPKYISDIPPAQRRVIEDYIARIRARLVRTLESQGIPVEPASIPATHSLRTILTFIDIAVEELRPRYMRGYGEVAPNAAVELNGIVGELQGLVSQLHRFVGVDAGDMQRRLEALERNGMDLSLLRTLERVIQDHGLVEFRATLAMIIDRLEEKSFEIAVFGRVSSGKSSLLNHIVRMNVLPVGVTPITAVPTRLVFGEIPRVRVAYADNRPSETLGIERLAEFVAEQHNPGNRKHVSRILVELPAPALQEGIVFVDTPGLGSLATSGTMETLAYLPRCDLGVVLIDAGSTLTPDDLQTIQMLYQAGIPANLLLSKAELLSESDRARVIVYARQHIRSELGLELSLRAVSVIPGHEQLLESWFRHDIEPLFERRDELRLQSLHRKIGRLRESVAAALRAHILRAEHSSSELKTEVRVLDANLRRATARIEETSATVKHITEELAGATEPAVRAAALTLIREDNSVMESAAAGQAVVQEAVQVLVQEKAKAVQDLLASLAQHLAQVLNDTARALHFNDAPAAGEFETVLREMPVFCAAPLHVGISLSPVAGFLGKRVAQRVAERQLRQRIGPALMQALRSHSESLGSWGQDIVAQFRRTFEASANTYRAQLERFLQGGDVAVDNKRKIEMDLEKLDVIAGIPGPTLRV